MRLTIYSQNKKMAFFLTLFLTFFLIFFLAFALSSCNLSKIQAGAQETMLKMRGFRPIFYKNANTTYAAFAKLSNKPTMVMVHGFGANGVLQWTETAGRLSDKYDIILPDLMFHGRSDILENSDSSKYSLEFQVECLHNLLQSVNRTKNLILVGNSYGGAVSAMYASKYPNEVSKLILNNAVTPFFSTKMAEATARQLGAKNIMDLLAPSTPEGSDITMRVVYYKPPYIPPFLKKQVELATRPNRENREKVLQYLIQHESFYKVFPYHFECPVYFIWGEHDPLIQLSTAKAAMEAWHIAPDHLQIIPKTAHVPNLEKSASFHQCLKKVL